MQRTERNSSNTCGAFTGPRRGGHFNRRGPELEYSLADKIRAEKLAENLKELSLERKPEMCREVEMNSPRRAYGEGEKFVVPSGPRPSRRRPGEDSDDDDDDDSDESDFFPGPGASKGKKQKGGKKKKGKKGKVIDFEGVLPQGCVSSKSVKDAGVPVMSKNGKNKAGMPPPPGYNPRQGPAGLAGAAGGGAAAFLPPGVAAEGGFDLAKSGGVGSFGPGGSFGAPTGKQGSAAGPHLMPIIPKDSSPINMKAAPSRAYVSPSGYSPCYDVKKTMGNAGSVRNAGMQMIPSTWNTMLKDSRGFYPAQYRQECDE